MKDTVYCERIQDTVFCNGCCYKCNIQKCEEDDIMLLDDVKVKILSSKVIRSPFAGGYCRRYYCKVSFLGKSFNITFFDSVYNYQRSMKLDKKAVINSALLDARAYELSRNFEDFCSEFGYEPYNDEGIDYNKKAMKVYNACKKQSEKIQNTFCPEHREMIENELQELGY